jgi:hypothetical protein
MMTYLPKTLWGWLGIAALVALVMWRGVLGVVGFLLLLGAFFYLYAVKDSQ